MAADKTETPANPAGLDDFREEARYRGLGWLFRTQEFWITLAVLAIGITVSLIAPNFATYSNLSNIFQNFCFIAILAVGITPVDQDSTDIGCAAGRRKRAGRLR